MPTFDVELQQEQEQADVVEKKSAVFHDLLRLSGKYWQNRFNPKMILRTSFSNCGSFVGHLSKHKKQRRRVEIAHQSCEIEQLLHSKMKHHVKGTGAECDHSVLMPENLVTSFFAELNASSSILDHLQGLSFLSRLERCQYSRMMWHEP